MNKYKLVIFLLALLAGTAEAAENFTLTVPLQISNLPAPVEIVKIRCELVRRDLSVAGTGESLVAVDPRDGSLMANEATVQIIHDDGPLERAIGWRCVLMLQVRNFLGLTAFEIPSRIGDPIYEPKPGTPFVGEVSDMIPGAESRIEVP